MVKESGVAMNQMKYPDWQGFFEDALQECDSEKILGQVSVTETAMTSRIQALRTTVSGDDERQAIADAANALVNLMRGILNSPGLGLAMSKESKANSGH
jgi:hypothetical protein